MKISSPETSIPHLTPSAHQRLYRGTTMNYASASADTSPVPVGPTLNRVNECNNRINDINSSLDALEDSMRIGLSHHHGEYGSIKGAETTIKPVPSVPLHGSLDELGERLTTTWHRINELTARVNL